ncbi:MAG: hypothetical protein JSS32_09425 [Verrucomicrobia bacterium]|nr:hypothetical protein [Verrucomicrobiota bacterium]
MTTAIPLWLSGAHSPKFSNSKERYTQGNTDFMKTLKQTQNIFKSILLNNWLNADQKAKVLELNGAFNGFMKSWKGITKTIDNSLSKHDWDPLTHEGYENIFKMIRLLLIQHSVYLFQMNQFIIDLAEKPTAFEYSDREISVVQLEMTKLNVAFLQTIAQERAI